MRILKKYPPNLKIGVFSRKGRILLEEALTNIPILNGKGKYVNLLMELAENQEIDMSQPLDNNLTYIDMFKNVGMPARRLSQI